MYQFLTRHIYFPMRRLKVPRVLAMIIVFTISGIFHEYLLAGAIQKITLMGIQGMLGNVPIILLQEKGEKYVNRKVGNIIFWVYFSVIMPPMTYISVTSEVMN